MAESEAWILEESVVSKCCPICNSDRSYYEFICEQKKIIRCEDCSHEFAYMQYKHDVYKAMELPECSDDPLNYFLTIRKSLKTGDSYSFYLPVTDSKAAVRNKYKWDGYRANRLQFFSTATIQNLLCKCGFEMIEICDADQNGVNVCCKVGTYRERRIISIIIPVYNEEKTVSDLLNSVINKQFGELDKELIIIESNSTDSTREIVKDFVAKHEGVKLILEEKPRGKGHAVRAGFDVASGDFITIQDGDLEYDINDYDKLIVPLVNYQRAFILGSRHMGDWKMRDFGAGKKATAAYVNFGHILLSSLINIGCGVSLKDPFTMYKMFRRDCISGLSFDGNRFEIDWEIVIKLIRKGYIPMEIPVNYISRGFDEGKKIALFKDPIICVIAFIRYRFLYKMPKRSNK